MGGSLKLAKAIVGKLREVVSLYDTLGDVCEGFLLFRKLLHNLTFRMSKDYSFY